ncbi:hypothetical protein [Streptomyces sp. NBC_00012]|uniref:hypothetical protein n=1 Tax=Streptomyces sp. NBC_00012 TaxID=2975621 RepID=UPI003863BC4B
MFRNRVPAFSAEKVAIQTEARLERQEILHRPSPPDHQLRRLGAGPDAPTPRRRGACGTTAQPAHMRRTSSASTTPRHNAAACSSPPPTRSASSPRYAMLRAQALSPEATVGLLDRLLGEQ